MNKLLSLSIAGILAISLSACDSGDPGDRALGGAALGGLTGAAIGNAIGGDTGSTLAGGAIGAAGGALIGANTAPRYYYPPPRRYYRY